MHIIKRLRMIDDLLGMIRHGMDSVAYDSTPDGPTFDTIHSPYSLP